MDNTKPKEINYKILGVTIVFVLGCGLSYYAGLHTQKNENKTSSKNQGFTQRQGGPMGGQRPTMGTVTAVSSSSITVKSSMDSSVSTLGITSSTTVTDNGESAKISDIEVGDSVMVQTGSSDTKTATKIMLNPSMPTDTGNTDSSPSNSSST